MTETRRSRWEAIRERLALRSNALTRQNRGVYSPKRRNEVLRLETLIEMCSRMIYGY